MVAWRGVAMGGKERLQYVVSSLRKREEDQNIARGIGSTDSIGRAQGRHDQFARILCVSVLVALS